MAYDQVTADLVRENERLRERVADLEALLEERDELLADEIARNRVKPQRDEARAEVERLRTSHREVERALEIAQRALRLAFDEEQA